MTRLFRVVSTCLFIVSCGQSALAFDVIAHRGASGYLPEHTLAAAALAHAQEPDYIEQDVVLSRDHVPVVLHDIHLETVTNVENVFPDRARNDGRYYAIDFTLAELKTLQIHERQNSDGTAVFATRFQGGGFTISTLREHLTLVQQLNRLRHTDIGFYTEIKSPAWHRQQGADISKIVLSTLADFGLIGQSARLFVQCFDLEEVKRIRNDLGYEGQLIMLIGENAWGESTTDYEALKTPEAMVSLAKYVDGIGPWIQQIVKPQSGELKPDWLHAAQQQGLLVHPYTFRTDAIPYGMTPSELFKVLTTLGVDGVFTDQVPPVSALLDKR